MAGGYHLFSTGEVLTAANVDNYLMNQTVMVFASAAARTTALTGVLAEGMLSYRLDATAGSRIEYYNGSAWTAISSYSPITLGSTALNNGATVTTVAGLTLTSPIINNGVLLSPLETTTVSATAATGTVNFDVITQGVLYYTTNASANFTLNVRGNSGTTLNTLMATGQSITIVFLNTNGTTAYYPTAYTIDGTSVTPKWQSGTAPTAGNVSAIDAYSLTITKTASATYTVFASQTKFA